MFPGHECLSNLFPFLYIYTQMRILSTWPILTFPYTFGIIFKLTEMSQALTIQNGCNYRLE